MDINTNWCSENPQQYMEINASNQTLVITRKYVFVQIPFSYQYIIKTTLSITIQMQGDFQCAPQFKFGAKIFRVESHRYILNHEVIRNTKNPERPFKSIIYQLSNM